MEAAVSLPIHKPKRIWNKFGAAFSFFGFLAHRANARFCFLWVLPQLSVACIVGAWITGRIRKRRAFLRSVMLFAFLRRLLLVRLHSGATGHGEKQREQKYYEANQGSDALTKQSLASSSLRKPADFSGPSGRSSSRFVAISQNARESSCWRSGRCL